MILALYRLGSWIPAPGVDSNTIKDYFNGKGGTILGLLSVFSGGALSRFALFALGIMPYVTASIILQLMTVVVPKLEQLQKEGETGYAKINQYTRYLTVGLSAAQATGYAYLFKRAGNLQANTGRIVLIVVTLTAGTTLLMWMGELITKRGVGNGISLLIFGSIVARIPHGLQAWWNNPDQVFRVIMPFIVLGVVAAIVFVQEGQRRIPVQYARRVIGRRMTCGSQTYLPLRVNMAGVIPVIFAASLMAIPPTLGQLLGQNRTNNFATDVQNFFNPQGWHYVLGESLLIIVFTYFYTAVTFNPVDQAENLRKYGGFIPGVRPGRPTAEFL